MLQPLRSVWRKACEYVTHWMVAGAILAGTGAAPEHWLAHMFDKLHLPADALHLWIANIDLRIILAATGFMMIGADIGWRLLRRSAPEPNGTRNAGATNMEAAVALGEPPLPADKRSTQLSAIVHADVAGYGRLTQADEIATHRQLSTCVDLIADRIRNSGGAVVRYAGNAVIARFKSTVAATHCAIGIQDTIR